MEASPTTRVDPRTNPGASGGGIRGPRKPTLDEMGPGTDLAVPARAPRVDPRAKAGAFGEAVSGPHKPTLDEMGPHAERGLPVDKLKPVRPARTIEVQDETERKARRGRTRKTGRPGA